MGWSGNRKSSAVLIYDDYRPRVWTVIWFDRKGVVRYTGVRYEKIDDSGLTVTDKDGKKMALKADSYIIAIPILPNTEGVKQFSGLVKESYAVGGCANQGLIVEAICEGARVGYTKFILTGAFIIKCNKAILLLIVKKEKNDDQQ